MKYESTQSKINKDLIRTFASLDAWFDKVLDDGMLDGEQWDMLDVLQHVITSNNHLLDLLSDGYDFALSQFIRQGRNEGEQSLYAMRFALREQLFHCLCLLDEMEVNMPTENASKQMNLYDKLFSLSSHLQYHLECFESSRSTVDS